MRSFSHTVWECRINVLVVHLSTINKNAKTRFHKKMHRLYFVCFVISFPIAIREISLNFTAGESLRHYDSGSIMSWEQGAEENGWIWTGGRE
jgi:hypothetical protein